MKETGAPLSLLERFQRVPLDRIIDEPSINPRRCTDGSLDELVGSIKERGILQPPTLSPLSEDTWRIVCGHRRIAAARRLQWTEIDARVTTLVADDEILIDALIENLCRSDLSCIEIAEGCQRLLELGRTQVEIATLLGRSQPTISRLMQLLELPSTVVDLLRERKLCKAQGEELLPLVGIMDQVSMVAFAESVLERSLNSNQVRKEVNHRLVASEKKKPFIASVVSAPKIAPESLTLPHRAPISSAIARDTVAPPHPVSMQRLGEVPNFRQAPSVPTQPNSEWLRVRDWLEASGMSVVDAVDLLKSITETVGLKGARQPGVWVRLEPSDGKLLAGLGDGDPGKLCGELIRKAHFARVPHEQNPGFRRAESTGLQEFGSRRPWCIVEKDGRFRAVERPGDAPHWNVVVQRGAQ